MFSKVTLASLFVAAAFAAPPPYTSDGPTPPIIHLESTVSRTNVNSPNIVPTPAPSVILLNGPSPPQPSASNPYAGYAGAPEPSGTPPVINLNAPAASPSSVIKLNRRQFAPTTTAGTFSFGGIVPSTSIPLLFPGTTTTSSSSSTFSPNNIPTSPPAPASAELPSGISAFTSTGANGIQTVFLLSTVTVTNSACTSSPVLNPSLTFNPFPALSSSTPAVTFSPFSVPAAVAQPPVNNPVSSPSTIILTAADSPSPPPGGITFSAVPFSITPAPTPTKASSSGTCDFACQLTAAV